jgi:hypothetical protein
MDEATRKSHGHNLKSAADAFAKAYPGFDLQRVKSTIARFPPYVANRYSPQQPSRIETGHIAMGAQYIAGEIMRQVCGYSFRNDLMPPQSRYYPA